MHSEAQLDVAVNSNQEKESCPLIGVIGMNVNEG